VIAYVHLLEHFPRRHHYMKPIFAALALASLMLFSPATTRAQDLDLSLAATPSPAKAFGLSILMPGLGHHHATGGSWSRSGFIYAATDLSMWISLLGSSWHRNQLISSFETLASRSAGAQIEGKDRTFFLNLASFESSDVYLDTMLRNRAWDRIDYVDDPSFLWSWESTESYNEFRSLRNRSETLKRRRSILIAGLVANRLLSGVISARKASKYSRVSVSAAFVPPVGDHPTIALRVGF